MEQQTFVDAIWKTELQDREITSWIAKSNLEETINNWQPLHAAVWKNRVNVVKLLIESGAPINTYQGNNLTPLIIAAWYGYTEVCRYLVDANGIDLNLRQANQMTALHIACWKGHKEIVEMLLGKGADAKLLSSNGDTALDLAKRYGYDEIVKLFAK